MPEIKKEMPICLSADDKYAQHLSVTIVSILRNLSNNYQATFFILDGGISKENKEKIAPFHQDYKFKLNYINMTGYDFSGFECNLPNTSLSTYFRLFLPSLLPDYKKAIYLDIDLVVDADISPLWELDISNNLLGVVNEPINTDPYLLKLGINDGMYFNAGVLVMNLNLMRQENIQQKLFNYVAYGHKPLRCDDQDVLNSVCHGRVFWLSPKYNVSTIYTKKNFNIQNFSHSPYDHPTLKDAIEHPVILHFSGPKKPWHYLCKHPLAKRYHYYLGLTPWKYNQYKYIDKTFYNIIKFFFFWLKREFRYFIRKRNLFPPKG